MILADQATKWAVVHQIGFQEAVPVIPGFFSLTHVYNTGAAFSMMHDSNRFFTILSLGCSRRSSFCGSISPGFERSGAGS